MDGHITFSNTEMQDLVNFCAKKKRNFRHLLPALITENRYKINITDNPTVFWIPHKDGMTGISLNEFRRFRSEQKEPYCVNSQNLHIRNATHR